MFFSSINPKLGVESGLRHFLDLFLVPGVLVLVLVLMKVTVCFEAKLLLSLCIQVRTSTRAP